MIRLLSLTTVRNREHPRPSESWSPSEPSIVLLLDPELDTELVTPEEDFNDIVI